MSSHRGVALSARTHAPVRRYARQLIPMCYIITLAFLFSAEFTDEYTQPGQMMFNGFGAISLTPAGIFSTFIWGLFTIFTLAMRVVYTTLTKTEAQMIAQALKCVARSAPSPRLPLRPPPSLRTLADVCSRCRCADVAPAGRSRVGRSPPQPRRPMPPKCRLRPTRHQRR